MPGAEPFKSKWSRAQKAACVEAIMDHGYNYRQAAEAAQLGELPGRGRDLDPFPVPNSTVAEWGKDARRLARQQTRAAEAPADRLRSGLGDLVATWERDVDALRKRKRAVKPEEIAALAKAGKELEAMARGLHKAPTARPADTDGADSGDQGGGEDFVGALAASEGKQGRKGARTGRSLGARSG